MKSTSMRTSFLVFAFLFVALSLSAQKDKGTISLKVKNQPLNVVLKSISDQSGVPISYSINQIPVNKPVTVNFRNKTLEQALEIVCKPLDLTFVFVENQMIIKPKKPEEVNVNPPKEDQRFTISGYINDSTSLEAIPGATVYTSDFKYGTTSNGYGFYSLTLPKGAYQIKCSFMGYKQDSIQVQLNKNIQKTFSLSLNEISLSAVVISIKEDSNHLVTINRLGVDELKPVTLSNMPVFFAEPDVIKAMHFIPGIKNTIDGSSYYYVRGGERDQNMILLDDAPIYNPSHLFGFFSCINPATLTEIKLHKSDFPSYVGGKLSSVLELRSKDGNKNKFSMSGETGLVTTRLSFEGPLFRKKSSYFISYRGSHLFRVADRLMSDIAAFNFGDLHAKLNLTVNPKNRLLFSFYGGSDNFFRQAGSDKNGIQWGNFLTSLRWNHIWNDRLFSNTIFYLSVYYYNLYASVNTNTRWNSMIATTGFKHDYTFYKSPEITHYFGFQGSFHNFNPGIILTNLEFSPYNVPRIQSLTTGESNLYYSTSRILSPLFSLRYGIRLTAYSNRGPAEYYLFDDAGTVTDSIIVDNYGRYNTFFRFDPSITLTYLISETQSVKFNYFSAHQYHQVLSNSISPFTSIEVWYPSTINVKPQRADQVSAGWFYHTGKHQLILSAEAYYKLLTHQFDYDNQAALFLNPYIESELRFGKTNVHGIELMIRKETGRLQGWFGYAYTRAIRETDGVNSNNPYRAYSDRPIDFSLFLQWQPGDKWLYTIGSIYASGMPFTSPTGYYDYMGYKVPVFSEKNNSRMPDYFRIDVSARLMLNNPLKRYHHYLTFSIYNLTNKKNPVFINFNKLIDENGKFEVPSNYAIDNPLQASQVLLLGIVPSIKYNFNF